MKGTIKGKDLATALDQIKTVVSKRNSLPILSCVKLEMGEGLTLSATDLEQSLRVQVEASVKAPGSVCVSSAKLWQIAKEVAWDTVTLSVGDNFGTTVKSVSGTWKLVGLSADDFPALGLTEGETVQVHAQSLLAGLQKTDYATSTDESRYTINGLLFRVAVDRLRLTATDGHRLADLTVPLDGTVETAWQGIVPSGAVDTLQAILKGADHAGLVVQENQLCVKVGASVLLARLIEGSFPNTDQILSGWDAREKRAELDVAATLAAVRRVVIMSEERSHPVRLTFDDGTLRLECNSPDVGESVAELPVPWAHAPLTLGVNAKYLTDYLAAAGSGTVEMRLQNAGDSMMLRSEGAGAGVIMPMRL